MSTEEPTTLAEHAGRLREALDAFDSRTRFYLQQWLAVRDTHPATNAATAADRLFLDRMAVRGADPEQAIRVLQEGLATARTFRRKGKKRYVRQLAAADLRTRVELALLAAQLVDDVEFRQGVEQACAAAEELERFAPGREAAAAWREISPFTEDPTQMMRRASALDEGSPSPEACLGLLSLAGLLMDDDPDRLEEAQTAVRKARLMSLRPGFVRSTTIRLELATARARLAARRGDLEEAVTEATRALYLPVEEEQVMATVPARLLLVDLLVATERWDRAGQEAGRLASIAEAHQDETLAGIARDCLAAIAADRDA